MAKGCATLLVILFLVGAIGFIARGSHTRAEAVSKSADDVRNEHVLAAIHGCKTWTETHSKLAVDSFVDDYELTGPPRLPASHYRVGVEYRTKGIGLLMRSSCEYAESGGQMYLVQARSAPLR